VKTKSAKVLKRPLHVQTADRWPNMGPFRTKLYDIVCPS